MDDNILIQAVLEKHANLTGLKFDITACHGGDTHRSYRAAINGSLDGHGCVFVKVNDLDQEKVLKSEFESLQLINNFQTLGYPKPLLFQTDQQKCFLVMTYHDIAPINEQSASTTYPEDLEREKEE